MLNNNLNFRLNKYTSGAFSKIIVIGFLINYFIGVAYILLLPPWEGYDEMGNYSYAQQIAANKIRFDIRADKLSADVVDYKFNAPVPYNTVVPYNKVNVYTYHEWFLKYDKINLIHEKPLRKRIFQESHVINVQGQHPQLYYLIISPFVEITSSMSWAWQLLTLRFVSWTIAYVGYILAYISCVCFITESIPRIVNTFKYMYMFWPILLPGFFPEFARIGNDSIVLFVFSVVLIFLCKIRRRCYRYIDFIKTGITLGVGNYVKITFFPLSVAVIVWLLCIAKIAETTSQKFKVYIGTIFTTITLILISAPLYIYNIQYKKSLTGLDDIVTIDLALPDGVNDAISNLYQIVKGISGTVLTFVWGGSASSAYPPIILLFPITFFLLLLLFISIDRTNIKNSNAILLSTLTLIFIFASLVYYLFCRISETGVGSGVPGWYLHVISGPICILISYGYCKLNYIYKKLKFTTIIILIYSIIVDIYIAINQALLYTGCAYKTEYDRFYTYGDKDCVQNIGQIFLRLSELCFLKTGLCFILIVICMTLYSLKYLIDYNRLKNA